MEQREVWEIESLEKERKVVKSQEMINIGETGAPLDMITHYEVLSVSCKHENNWYNTGYHKTIEHQEAYSYLKV